MWDTAFLYNNWWVSWWRYKMETFSAILALCELNFSRSPVNSPQKGQWSGALMFPLICTWTKICANNRFYELVNNPKHVFVTLEGVPSQEALGEHMDEGLDSLDFDVVLQLMRIVLPGKTLRCFQIVRPAVMRYAIPVRGRWMATEK